MHQNSWDARQAAQYCLNNNESPEVLANMIKHQNAQGLVPQIPAIDVNMFNHLIQRGLRFTVRA